MPTRKASAQWKGPIAGGSGTLTVAGNTLPYSAASRFEEAGGTNPEELIAAAHAGCFAMALSAALSRAGHEVRQLDSSAAVRITKGDDGWSIDRIELTVRGDVAEIDEETFVSLANGAKLNCPVSKALASVPEITLDAALI